MLSGRLTQTQRCCLTLANNLGQDASSHQQTCCIEGRLALGLVTRQTPDVCTVLRLNSPLQVQLLHREAIQLRTALTRVCKEAAAYKQDVKAAQVQRMSCALCPHALHFKACPYRDLLREVMGSVVGTAHAWECRLL